MAACVRLLGTAVARAQGNLLVLRATTQGTREPGRAVGAGISCFVALGKAESKSCAGGGSQPLAPLSLLHFNGGGGRRGTSAGMPMSPRRGQLMQGGGTAPGPSCFPFLSVV